MSGMALIPLDDYTEICDAVREKTGTSDLIKSGDMADLVKSISTGGDDKGRVLLAEFQTVGNNGEAYPVDFIMPDLVEIHMSSSVSIPGAASMVGSFNKSTNPYTIANADFILGSSINLDQETLYRGLVYSYGASSLFIGTNGSAITASTSYKSASLAGQRITSMKVAQVNNGNTIPAGCTVRVYGWIA